MADAFSWVGFILVNLGCITLISWGASNYWVFGFVLTALYTVLLAAAARYCQRSSTEEENRDNDDPIESQLAFDSRASLLYALTVLSLGVTGFFLPVNIFGDSCYVDPYATDQGYWHIDYGTLPPQGPKMGSRGCQRHSSCFVHVSRVVRSYLVRRRQGQ